MLRLGVALAVLGASAIAYLCGYIWPWGWGVGVVLFMFSFMDDD